MNTLKCYLEDGTFFVANNHGHHSEDYLKVGELVFNTGMTGYQEILTDPSYCGQFIVMTYPLIGNYGYFHCDDESERPKAFGLITRDYTEKSYNPGLDSQLHEFLTDYQLPWLTGVDTRFLVKKIRSLGTCKMIMSARELSKDEVNEEFGKPLATNQVEQCSLKSKITHPFVGSKVVLMDYGAKTNIARSLLNLGFEVSVLPHTSSFHDIARLKPVAVVLSNGPGDPQDIPDEIIKTVYELSTHFPTLGICLGHQLIARAYGMKTYKLKFGHRGVNHPVKNMISGQSFITSQNHGYAVDEKTMSKDFIISYRSLNDNTVEGMNHKTLPLMTIQFHPEAAPGPHDTKMIFQEFFNKCVQGLYEKRN
jgi:carbamoyl-phosphate synthase small subunit